jgi:hypothetical protein
MAADANWARYVFASIALVLKGIATDNGLPVLVEHLDERSEAFISSSDQVEIRITGPFISEPSKGYFCIEVAVNVLLKSRYDGERKNAYTILKAAGLYQEAMSGEIPVWNYGGEAGDYQDDDPSSQVFLGCLRPKAGRNEATRVFNFGQADPVEKVKESVVDAHFVMEISE